jgi:hypothetical protein
VFQDRGLRLCDEGRGGGALVPPGGGKDTDGLVVAGQTVDAGLDQNQAELGVLVLAVALEVLADGNGLVVVSIVRGHAGVQDQLYMIVRTFLMSM